MWRAGSSGRKWPPRVVDGFGRDKNDGLRVHVAGEASHKQVVDVTRERKGAGGSDPRMKILRVAAPRRVAREALVVYLETNLNFGRSRRRPLVPALSHVNGCPTGDPDAGVVSARHAEGLDGVAPGVRPAIEEGHFIAVYGERHALAHAESGEGG